jgi:hypothetical protein
LEGICLPIVEPRACGNNRSSVDTGGYSCIDTHGYSRIDTGGYSRIDTGANG